MSEKLATLNAIKVSLKEGEVARKYLLKSNLLDKEFEIIKEDGFIFFPIKDEYFKYADIKWNIIKRTFIQKEKIETYQQKLQNILPIELHDFIPSSHDRIGDVILVKIPLELLEYKNAIGKAMLHQFGVRSVFSKKGDISSIYRVAKWECVAGEDDSKVTHKMNNLRFNLNFNDVYFNSRLGLEYNTVAEICKDNWVIIDMFCGIGPFSLTVASLKNVSVYACDINPKSIYYLQENIDLNRKRLIGSITSFQGDINEKIHSFPKANFIFMNLPEAAIDYLELALFKIKIEGIIHLHNFVRMKDKSKKEEIIKIKNTIEDTINDFIVNNKNSELEQFIIEHRILREVSPSKTHVVWEIRF